MPAPSSSWTVIASTAVDSDSPIDEPLMQALRGNLIHLEEWLGLNYTAAQDHDHDGVNSKNVLLADASIATAKYQDASVTNAKLAGPALGFIARADVSGLSAAVTLAASDTTIATVDLGSVVSGDRILASGFFVYTAASGTVVGKIAKSSGTATVVALASSSALYSQEGSAGNNNISVNGIINVTGSGTLILKLYGTDVGATAAIATNFGQLQAIVLKGA